MPNPAPLWLDRLRSPLGELLLVGNGQALCALDFGDYESRLYKLLTKRYSHFELQPPPSPLDWCDRVTAYFDRDWSSLLGIPISLGGTAFQQQVWLTLPSIPVGSVLTYGQLAAQLGQPKAARAVGMANALNPIALILPCHRVIGAQRRLTGYAGGLDRKRWLLQHEGVELQATPGKSSVGESAPTILPLGLAAASEIAKNPIVPA